LRNTLIVGLILLFATGTFAGTTTIQPTTTLAAETGNNTSAANTFAGLSNGNEAAGNISKAPIRSLLYTGATTKIYAHLMPWFGTSSHISVGYDSSDPAQAAAQVNDMVSRGIDGVIVDWYGPNSTHHNRATKNTLASAEQHQNFEFAICEDWGAVKNSLDPTAQTISDLNYVWQTFAQSPAYMKRNGRPVIAFFGFEGQSVDLTVVKAALTFNPLFIMRNSGGFSKTYSDGSFSWMATKTSGYDNYMSLPYLDDFYAVGLKYSNQMMIGSGFKGFDDSLASWSGGKHVLQYCGQTWLHSFAEAGRYFSANNQLGQLQIVTWNDYEEGTAIEPGVDNCVAITSWMSGSTLNWSITGDESTIDHYSIYASLDGTNLAKIGESAAGTTGLDLATLSLAPANYQFFVKAVGKASIVNHMSAAVSYSVDGTTAPSVTPADYAMAVTPLAVQVTQGGSATLNIGVNSVNSAFTSPVTLACSNLPAYMSCTFSKASVVPGANGASTVLTIQASVPASARHRDPFGWTMLPAFGFVFVLGSGVEKRKKQIAVLALLLVLVTLGVGCGGGATSTPTTIHSSQTTPNPGTYTITITAMGGNLVKTTTATVTVQ
jgi:hypothetical protein